VNLRHSNQHQIPEPIGDLSVSILKGTILPHLPLRNVGAFSARCKRETSRNIAQNKVPKTQYDSQLQLVF
jgi:hypothetical protein